jgi:hypothetical protein
MNRLLTAGCVFPAGIKYLYWKKILIPKFNKNFRCDEVTYLKVLPLMKRCGRLVAFEINIVDPYKDVCESHNTALAMW